MMASFPMVWQVIFNMWRFLGIPETVQGRTQFRTMRADGSVIWDDVIPMPWEKLPWVALELFAESPVKSTVMTNDFEDSMEGLIKGGAGDMGPAQGLPGPRTTQQAWWVRHRMGRRVRSITRRSIDGSFGIAFGRVGGHYRRVGPDNNPLVRRSRGIVMAKNKPMFGCWSMIVSDWIVWFIWHVIDIAKDVCCCVRKPKVAKF